MTKKKKKKYYVVWDGITPGVYESWNECQLQIKGYPNAKYKAFESLEEAKDAFHESYQDHYTKRSNTPKSNTDYSDEIIWDSISVDAACSGNPGKMEYRGVNTKNSDEIFYQGPFEQGTNNIGEFLALVHALAYLKQIGDKTTPVYSDSRIAIGWIKKKAINTKVKKTAANAILFQYIERAQNWLKNNRIETKIIKWETKRWGEIPADFGRK